MPLPAKILRSGGFLVIFLCGCWVLYPQTLSISPNPITLRMAQGGPVVNPQAVSVGAAGAALEWPASVSDDAPPISLSAMEGSTPATVSIGVVGWRAEGMAAGSYSGRITFNAPGAAPATVTVNWSVVPRLPDPKFTYFSGPEGCTQPDGYPDAALCTVPNEAPPGNFKPPGVGGSYVDPNFGATVKALTGPGVYHTYSANNPLSAKNTYLMTYPSSGTFDVVLTATGKVAFSRV